MEIAIGTAIGVGARPAAGVSFSSRTQAATNTTVTNDGTIDAVNWPSTFTLKADSHGKLFALFQRTAGGAKAIFLVASNDNGVTWNDQTGPNQATVIRGTAYYDEPNNLLHVLWDYEGMAYRNYSLTRDGSNNITGITANGSGLLFMDDQNSTGVKCEHASLVYIPPADSGTALGTLVAVWGMGHSGFGNEIRCSMCPMATAATPRTLANWVTPDGLASDTNGIGGTNPGIAYRKFFSSANNVSPSVYVGRKLAGTHAKDLYIAHSTGAAMGSDAYLFRRAAWNAGAHNFSGGLTGVSTISSVIVAGSPSGGWGSIHQNGSAWIEDTPRDTMLWGLARYLNNTDGSTVTLASVDGSDAVSLIDVYKAGKTHSYMPGIAIARHGGLDAILAAYLRTDTEDIWITAYRGGAKVAADASLLDRVHCDLPTLIDGAVANGVIHCFSRNQTGVAPAPPYFGQHAGIVLS